MLRVLKYKPPDEISQGFRQGLVDGNKQVFRKPKRMIHSLLVNKVTCSENKVREKGFGCPSKKEEECMLLFGGGQQAGQT